MKKFFILLISINIIFSSLSLKVFSFWNQSIAVPNFLNDRFNQQIGYFEYYELKINDVYGNIKKIDSAGESLNRPGQSHILLTNDNEIITWGDNHWGNLGIKGNQNNPITVPTTLDLTTVNPNLASDEYIIDIARTTYNSLFITNKNNAYISGLSGYEAVYSGIIHLYDNKGTVGRVGISNGTYINQFVKTDPIPLDNNESIIKVAGGWDFFVLLTSAGNVITFGWNSFGALGRGTLNGFTFGDKSDNDHEYPSPTKIPSNSFNYEKVIDISVGYDHVVAITESSLDNPTGSVYVWGSNAKNQLGLTNQAGHQGTPILVTLDPIYSKTSFKAVFATPNSTYIVTENLVFGFGDNEAYNVLGNIYSDGSTITEKTVYSDNNYMLSVKTNITMFMPYYDNQSKTLTQKIIKINGGVYNSAILYDNGCLYVVGSNDSYQLGLSDLDCPDNTAKSAGINNHRLYGMYPIGNTVNQSIYTISGRYYLVHNLPKTIHDISMSEGVSLLWTNDGILYFSGSNAHGNAGVNNQSGDSSSLSNLGITLNNAGNTVNTPIFLMTNLMLCHEIFVGMYLPTTNLNLRINSIINLSYDLYSDSSYTNKITTPFIMPSKNIIIYVKRYI